MNGLRHLIIIFASIAICISCATSSESGSDSGENGDLSALDSNANPTDAALESNLNQTEAKQTPPAADQPPADEFAQFAEPPPAEVAPAPEPGPQPTEVPPTPTVEAPPPQLEAPVVQATPATPSSDSIATSGPQSKALVPSAQDAGGLVHVKKLLFKGNDNGGTVVVEGDGPMTFTSRMNHTMGQFVLEIPNSTLSPKLRQPYITKDFDALIGGIDAYQAKGSKLSRIVIHLRPGATEPVVQAEGSSLIVVAKEPTKDSAPQKEDVKLLSYSSLQDFLAGNMTFSGKKISIETDEMELKDLFKLIGEEAGINLMVGDEVKGTINVKLRQVPWDQALVMILKSKKLAYSKIGNVLRIATIADLRGEEKEMLESAKAKMAIDPLVVKVLPINYAKIDEITKQVEPFLTKDRGSVRGDTRTNAIVVSDVEEVIVRVSKLIQAIDIPPQQVLIEGKVVEAQDTFENQLGVSWGASGVPTQAGTSQIGGLVSSQASVSVSPGAVGAPTMAINYNVGVLDVLGNLSMILGLQEFEGKVKVLSSPRVLALHNEEARIYQNQKIPYNTSTPNAAGLPPSVKVDFVDVKLELKVTPQITNDGAVMMKVDVTREFAGATTDPKAAPPVHSRQSNTKVLVRNGQTAVIGGIYQSDFSDSESRVPWFGQIPVFGWLFKSKKISDTKNELLIFLTPRILAQLDSSAVSSATSGLKVQDNPSAGVSTNPDNGPALE